MFRIVEKSGPGRTHLIRATMLRVTIRIRSTVLETVELRNEGRQ
jgi:hypothetical protein